MCLVKLSASQIELAIASAITTALASRIMIVKDVIAIDQTDALWTDKSDQWVA
jgi:hypothetical protein